MSARTPVSERQVRSLLWAVLGFALILRLAAIQAITGLHTPAWLEPASDSRIHIALVGNLLSGRGFSLFGVPTAETPPLYIFLLAGLYRVSHDPAVVRLVQAALGALDCALLYAIGARLFDRTTALIGAALLAAYPLAVYLAGLHLTENLFLPLLLLAVLQSVRVARRPSAVGACLLGALIGLAALTRAVFLAFLPFLLPWAMIAWGPRRPATYGAVALVMLSAAAVILPWSVRNAVVLHAFAPVQDNGGLMFWAGNNAASDGGIVWPTRRTWTATRPPDTRLYGWTDLSVAQANRLYTREALRWIREHPRAYVHLLGRKLARLYSVTKSQDRQSVPVPGPVAVLQLAVLLSAACGIALSLRQWRSLAMLFFLIAFTNITVLLFSGATRYEVPMLPGLLLFSAAAASRLWAYAAQSLRPVFATPVGVEKVELR